MPLREYLVALSYLWLVGRDKSQLCSGHSVSVRGENAGDGRKHVVGGGALQPKHANDDHKDRRKHERVFGKALSLVA